MSAKYWLNPPRGGGLRWVEPTINNTAYYKWGNYKQRVWRFPYNTATNLHPTAKHWLMDYSYSKGIIVHQRSSYNMNHKYIKRPFTKAWLEFLYYKQVTGKLYILPWLFFVWLVCGASMRAYDNTAYDYYYFTD